MRQYPKANLLCEAKTHFILGGTISLGPSADHTALPELLAQSSKHLTFDSFLADKGYDSERIHELCRNEHGIRLSIIPAKKNAMSGRRWPKTKYRRQMRKRFFEKAYGQRWQIESVISSLKRRLGSKLASRSWDTQQAEGYLKILSYNILLMAAAFRFIIFSTEQSNLVVLGKNLGCDGECGHQNLERLLYLS